MERKNMGKRVNFYFFLFCDARNICIVQNKCILLISYSEFPMETWPGFFF